MNWYHWFLFPFSVIFWLITSLRNLFFNFGWLKSAKFDVPIIGVGNITVGGTGKTPHTAYIGNLLKHKNNIAILSKGYARKSKDFKYVELDSLVSQVGDEPLQTKQNFPEQIVAVDHQRVNGVLNILHDHPNTSAILLDDAFQHRSIKIGYNILLTDYNRLFYKDYILPLGHLRESKKGIERANCIIVTKCPNEMSVNEAEEIKKAINFKKDIYFTKIIYGKITALKNKETFIDFKDISEVLLVTAIANNKAVIELLESKKIKFDTIFYRDHYNYNEKDIDNIIERRNQLGNNSILLTTEKDAQKLKSFQKLEELPVYYLKVTVDFLWNKDKFDKNLNDYVRNNQTNYRVS